MNKPISTNYTIGAAFIISISENNSFEDLKKPINTNPFQTVSLVVATQSKNTLKLPKTNEMKMIQ
jgi:hypothetical protein